MTDIYKNTSEQEKNIQPPIKNRATEEKEKTEALTQVNPPKIKEVKFFSDPKKVKKRGEGSIIAFQTGFTALFCLLYTLSRLFVPELYQNINIYLERIFRW